MTVAGFDPGSNVFGIGIVQKQGAGFSLISSAEIVLKGPSFNNKMIVLIRELNVILEENRIDEFAIEDGFLGKNVSSMNTLSKVRGVVLATILNHRRDLHFYSPREIKISVTGNGNAGKEQVKKSVGLLLGMTNPGFGYDESDAIAVALCHLMKKREGELRK